MEMLTKLKEEELLKRVASGDEEAFNELYKRYCKLVFFVANQTCRNETDAQDILQETFLTIKDHIKDLRNPKYFRLWVYRIISSKCKNMFNKNKRLVGISNEEHFNNTIVEERIDRVPQKSMKFQNDKEILTDFINQLPESQRIVLVMFYMEQFSINEIADSLQIPIGTVKSRLSTARKFIESKVRTYEQQEQVPLNFRFVGAQGIAACLLASYESMQVPSVLLPAIQTSLIKGIRDSIQNSIATHWIGAAALTCAVTVGVGGITFSKLSNAKPEEGNVSAILQDNETAKDFIPIQLSDELISNAKEGFYALQLRACCEKDIEDMSIEDLRAMKTLFIEMKKNGGEYYEQLVENGWVKAYEEKVGI